MRRGEIYYVKNSNPLGGSLIASNRPAIIVSNNTNNNFSNVVEIVYLTGSTKYNLPTHVAINSTGKPSTALCSTIHSVEKRDLETFICKCTAREMNSIDIALQISLGIEAGERESATENESTNDTEGRGDLIRVTAERDAYKNLYEKLIEKVLA